MAIRPILIDEDSPFSGENCALCKEPFASGEEIVVCPDDATRHHIQCWIANGNRWRQLITEGEGGFYGFNDLHAALCFAALGWSDDLADLEAEPKHRRNSPIPSASCPATCPCPWSRRSRRITKSGLMMRSICWLRCGPWCHSARRASDTDKVQAHGRSLERKARTLS